ncbi:cation:proton antiporter [candidate division KSB1 bacterium]|nr:MAG: cation:proton antiporter [candidate division KSB1 bacterium]
MKNTNFVTGSFIALTLVVILGIFFFQALNQPAHEGKTMPVDNVHLEDRVSLHYVLKNVNEASQYLESHGKSYFNERDEVPSKTIEFGKSKNLEEGSANEVTSIVVNYRGFDTLGEVTVLFISIIGLTLLMRGINNKKIREPSLILKTGTTFLSPLIVLFGIYVFVHGHLTPGGGFPGGAIIASGILLLIIGLESFQFNSVLSKSIESLAGLAFVGIALAGLFVKKSFLANFMPTGTVGYLYSAGMVALIYIVVGLKVGAELASGIAKLKEGGKND